MSQEDNKPVAASINSSASIVEEAQEEIIHVDLPIVEMEEVEYSSNQESNDPEGLVRDENGNIINYPEAPPMTDSEVKEDHSGNSLSEMLTSTLDKAAIDIEKIKEDAEQGKTPEQYDEEAGEVDLVAFVNEELNNLGIDHLPGWSDLTFDEDFKLNKMSYQRYVINRILRIIVGMIGVEKNIFTMSHRYLITDEGSVELWKANTIQTLEFIASSQKEEVNDEKPGSDNEVHSGQH